jgi:nucleotide-binding universal stress UspA family protein
MTVRPADWESPVVVPEAAVPERILVPFDGSHNAERALAWARIIALGTGSEVLVLVGYTQPLTMRGRGAAYVEAVRDELADEAAELAREGVQVLVTAGVQARGIVLKGDITRGILETAAQEGCGLILLGRQGLTAEVGGVSGAAGMIRDLLQGGVSEKVTRHAEVPVLVVP